MLKNPLNPKPNDEDLILFYPGHPLFNFILNNSPIPGSLREGVNFFVVDSESGIMREANEKSLEDYLYGGEYDLVMEEEEDVYDY